ncbi:MAG: metal-dependent hydrolase [Candidatus Altiarchaeota archaeon]
MSGYLGHALAYLLIAFPLTFLLLSYGPGYDYVALTVGVAVGLFYALLPDIDAPSSRVRRMIGKALLGTVIAALLGYLGGVFDERAIYLAVALNGFLYVLWYVKHRGILHTPLAGVVFSAPLWLVEPVYAAYAFTGFLVHLILDGEVFG